ncbi:hypothetical protein LCGC14_1238730 [marine sediment metagenome]|uniref:Phage gp6-like head-tail connector protein n=1 Tax=marine sediment metagenome TaxID=412755 RepID=A0A0F9LTM2_9ZZZZ
MALVLITAPTTEPISLSVAKGHLRIDSPAFEDDITTTQTIAPDNHSISTVTGTGVDVLGSKVVVNLLSGNNGTSGTVDAKLQDSDDNSTFTDVTDGAFTQVTEANDNATQELTYVGTKQYLRVLAVVATAACDFAATIVEDAVTGSEDTLLTNLIKAARFYCEDFQKRAYITQTWELWLDRFPRVDFIEIPLPMLQSITSVKYFDVDDTEAPFSSGSYFVDTKSEPGRVALNFGEQWPTTTLRPANGVVVRFVAGYGDAASNVPESIRQAILLTLGNWYENREAVVSGSMNELPIGAKALLQQDRIFKF